jgi:hypothetical protein
MTARLAFWQAMTAVSPENEIVGNFLSQKLGMSQALDFHPSRKYQFVRLNPSNMSPRPSALSLLYIGTFHALHWTSFKYMWHHSDLQIHLRAASALQYQYAPFLPFFTLLAFQHLYTHHTSLSFLRPSMLRTFTNTLCVLSTPLWSIYTALHLLLVYQSTHIAFRYMWGLQRKEICFLESHIPLKQR